jgi:hypothetical protein
MASLQKKVGILLALNQSKTRSLIDILPKRQLILISDDEFEKVADSEYRDMGDALKGFKNIPLFKPETVAEAQSLATTVSQQKKLISGSILKSGIDLGNYRVGPAEKGKAFDLVLKSDLDNRWRCLGTYDTEAEGFYAANRWRSDLIDISRDSEGFHLIEHILLRPLSRKTHQITVPENFYAFRISVVFPSWTARFDDPEFRDFAQETICLNCPAHIYPNFFWLRLDQMQTFEDLYSNWLAAKCDAGIAADEVDDRSQALIVFLQEHLGSTLK